MIDLAGTFAVAAALGPRSDWAPILVLLVIGVLFAAGTVVASVVIGPGRTGKAKQTTYESGMNPIGDTHRRFNVRFYIVAMIFLVFDVEIIFLYPWATYFPVASDMAIRGLLLAEVVLFVVILLVAYAYAWGKGAFRWD